KLAWEQDHLVVRDLGSRNGTWVFVEGPHRLADGDLLLIGAQVIRFRRLGYPGPHAPDADATRRMGSLTPSADIASLTQLRSDGSVRDVVQLSPGRDIRVGRERGEWVFPYDPSMSAEHALVRSEDADFVVVDAGSRNGLALAAHVKVGRRSAIKVMNPSMVHDPDAVARFNREAANASRITHPNVCAIYDFGETPDGTIYLAMEFIEGEPLTDVLAREGALPAHRAGHIFLQVADALQAAHDLGIVHRDLKPDNIMISRGREGSDVVKVVDFGIAKAVGGDDSQKVTKTGLVVGTPEFMSPEQLSGDKLDGRSDLYSLALVLFKTLTGKLPFEATTVQETMIKRLTDEPVKLAAARPDLQFPTGLQETLDAALARSPVDRYQSAAKFAADAGAVLGLGRGAGAGAPIPATRADGDEKTQLLDRVATKVVKRRSLTPAVIGAVVVLGGGGAAVAVFGGGGKGTRQVAPSVRADTATRPADTGGARTASGPSRRETGAVRDGAHPAAIDATKE